jgi:hypothetical protein
MIKKKDSLETLYGTRDVIPKREVSLETISLSKVVITLVESVSLRR